MFVLTRKSKLFGMFCLLFVLSASPLFFGGFLSSCASAGEPVRVSLSVEGRSMHETLQMLESVSGVRFHYHRADLPRRSISIRISNVRLENAVDLILADTGLAWERIESGVQVGLSVDGRVYAGSMRPPYRMQGVSAQWDDRYRDRYDDWRHDRPYDDRYRDDRYYDDRYRRPTTAERRPLRDVPSLQERTDGLARLIQNVVAPDSWRERVVEPDDEPEPDTDDGWIW